ncbi:MAG: FAD-dependent oxidoreductase [Planctomycetia bacterium]|nr:FAD-dependent oxidoreductase [Planctomycetia bacterium]
MKVIIIGGVAAGASAAARLRRLDENAEIILLEKGKFISYANCGLPYHLGGVIPARENLLVMTAAKFQGWFNIDVRTESEAIRINRAEKILTIRNGEREYTETYDKLLLTTGAVPMELKTPGDEDERIHHLWTIGDMDRVVNTLKTGAKNTVIVGAGFIGLEVAENLLERDLNVTIIQRGEHVLPTMDKEMALPLAQELLASGIDLKLSRTVVAYEKDSAENAMENTAENTVRNVTETGKDTLFAVLDNGERIPADVVIVSAGVRPNSMLAQAAGLECGPRGHICVNEFLQTSDPDIYAAGDAVEITEPIFGGKTAIPLAGPANKQGRIAADNLAGGSKTYHGSYGASVVKVGRMNAASVGFTEARLREMGKDFRKIYIHPSSSASYYPGAARLDIKLLFGDDGTIYGAQVVGTKGVDKRIDTIAQAMQSGRKAPELGELELSYAPPFSSAKDPVNFAGFVAENVLTGRSDVVYPDTIPTDACVLDVREPAENELGTIPGALNIRLADLRGRLAELDREKLIVCCCQVGLRGYLAERILKQNGFRAANLSGGWLTWKMFFPGEMSVSRKTEPEVKMALNPEKKIEPEVKMELNPEKKIEPAVKPLTVVETLDVRTLPCPGPVVKLKETMDKMAVGSAIHLMAATTFEEDLRRWAKSSGNTLLDVKRVAEWIEVDVVKGGGDESGAGYGAGAETASDGGTCSGNCPVPKMGMNASGNGNGNTTAIILFSNDFDKAMAAMILANGLVAAGMNVEIFFTFWGLSVLRKNPAPYLQKTLMERMFSWMLPRGAEKLALSKMNMLGMGSAMMKNVMAQKNVLTLPELIRSARGAGVRFIACDMAMSVMGITREELIEIDEVAGVATFAEIAKRSQNTLFI